METETPLTTEAGKPEQGSVALTESAGPPVLARELALESLSAAVPPPPVLSFPRIGSIAASTSLLGVQAVKAAPGALYSYPAAGALTLQSTGSDRLCWAMYRFEGLDASMLPLQIEAVLSGELPSSYYLGLSNYAAQSWVWTTVNTPSGVDKVFTDIPFSISPDGSLYCLVAVYGEAVAEVSRLDLTADIALPPPLDFSASTDWPYGIKLSWTDPALSFDPDGDGPEQFDYSFVQIEKAADVRGPWTVLQNVSPSQQAFWLAGASAPPTGLAMYFRARTRLQGQNGPPGNAVRGIRQFPAPAGLTATRGEYLDRVVLEWQAVAGANEYEVFYRPLDNPAAGFTALGSAVAPFFSHSWTSGCENGLPYEYAVEAHAPDPFISQRSKPAVGWRDAPAPRNVTATNGEFYDRIAVSWDAVPGASGYVVHWALLGTAPPQVQYSEGFGSAVDTDYQILLEDPSLQNYEFQIDVAISSPSGRKSDPVIGSFNSLPDVRIVSNPADGTAPLHLILNANVLSDGGAALVDYKWSVDGNVLQSDPTQPVAETTLPGGLHAIKLEVTNAAGESGSDEMSVAAGGWIHTWGGAEQSGAWDPSTGENEAVYLAASDSDLPVVIKRNAAGGLLWARNLGDDPDSYWHGYFGAGDFYANLISDVVEGSSYHKPCVANLTPDGNFNWAKLLSDPGTDDIGTGWGLAIGSDGESYLVTRGSQERVTKLSASGDVLWSRSFDGDVSFEIQHVSCAPGLVVVSGQADAGFALLALDENGGLLWQKYLIDARSYRAFVDAVGSVVVSTNGADASESILISLNFAGQLQWSRTLSFSYINTPWLLFDAADNKILLGDYSTESQFGNGGYALLLDGTGAKLGSWLLKDTEIYGGSIGPDAVYLCGKSESVRFGSVQLDSELSTGPANPLIVDASFTVTDRAAVAEDANLSLTDAAGTNDSVSDHFQDSESLTVKLPY